MADEETTPPAEGTPAPAPTFVPVDDFKRLENQLAGLTGTLDEQRKTITSLQALLINARTPAPAPAPAIEQVSDQEIDEAATVGQGVGGKVRKAIHAEVQKLVRERIDPLQRLGLESMGNFAFEMARPKMEHYERYKAEIDDIIAAMSPAIRVQPQSYVLAYQTVIGKHVGELVEEAKAAGAKGAEKGSGDPPTPNGRTGRTAGKSGGIPPIEEVFSTDAVKALGGLSSDDFAKGLGYKNWEDYYKRTIVEATT